MDTRSKKTKNYIEHFFNNETNGGENGDINREQQEQDKQEKQEKPYKQENPDKQENPYKQETPYKQENPDEISSILEEDLINAPVSDSKTAFIENVEIYKSISTGQQYTLANESLLSKDIQFLESGQIYKVRMCIYKTILSGVSPYLLYYMKKSIDSANIETIKFPEYTFTYGSQETNKYGGSEQQEERDGEQESEEMEDNESDIMDKIELTQQLVDVFSFRICGDENCGKYFKGIYQTESDKKENTFYIVFDATRIDEPVSSQLLPAVVYEILVTGKLGNTLFDTSVPQLFKEITNKNDTLDFHHLKTIDGEYIHSPYCLFMCSEKEDVLIPVVESEVVGEPIKEKQQEPEEKEPEEKEPEEKEPTYIKGGSRTLYNIKQNDRELITYPKINHEQLGYYTFFSLNPIQPSMENLRRFLVFADDSRIKTLSLEKNEMEKIENLYTIEEEKYTCITFFEENIQLWCVKSQDYFIEL